MKTLKIGTDCSGIEAPIQALKLFKDISISHEFSSEIDSYAKKSLLANYEPKLFFEDVCSKRDLPKLDIYVAGPPCQNSSLAGNRLGSKDVRANIFYNCLETIEKSLPTIFILENVKGILSVEKGTFWSNILLHLNKLKDYEVYYKVLNTKDYEIPQNRERIFIVGLKKSKIIKEFKFPDPVPCKDIKLFVDESDTHKDQIPHHILENCPEKIKNHKGIFIDFSFLKYTSADSYQTFAPTILTNNTSIWCRPMHRKINIKELLMLQGFPVDFKQVVSNSQFRKQIGNSMSVSVLYYLFKECFLAVEF